MKVLDVLTVACDFTGNEELASKLDNIETLSTNEQKLLKKLVDCFNLVQNEICTQYIPLERIEKVCAKDFKVDYAAFSKMPISVVWAKDRLGRNLRFKQFSDYLMVFSTEATVKYCYAPKVLAAQDELDEAIVPMRIYAYGIAREYFLLENLSDDADIWEARFKDSLSLFARKKREVRLPSRRWI